MKQINDKLYMTFDEYDEVSERCAKLNKLKDRNALTVKTMYPTVEQMEVHHVAYHMDKYFPYLLFYYENKIDDMEEDEEYQKMVAYLKKLFHDHVVIVDSQHEIDIAEKEANKE